MSNLKDQALEYFTAFSNKELDALAGMFDDHVTLRDWEMSASGKTAVLAANKNIFDSVETITVTPLKLYHMPILYPQRYPLTFMIMMV